MGFGLSVRVRVPSSPRITSIVKAPPASAPPTMPSVTDTSRESSKTSSTTPAVAPLWLLSNSEIHTSSRRERKRSSRSRACTPGNYATVIAHNPDQKKSKVKLPSGSKKTIPSANRAMVGIVAGGGRIDKPLLKAGRAYFKYKAKRNSWPKVRGVAMNPVEHPHGGGNHQHIGMASTVRRDTSAGRKVGLIAARRTGRLTGTKNKGKEEK